MIKLIVAIAKNKAIGKDNDLIWHLPADMRFFSETTKDSIVLMGRKNWDSIPAKYRPLPSRLNLVVTRDESFSEDGCEVYHSIEDAIHKYENDLRDLYIIGGGQIYEYCLKNELVNEMLITHIDASFEADTFFPDFKKENWQIEDIMDFKADDKNPYNFVVKRYTKAI